MEISATGSLAITECSVPLLAEVFTSLRVVPAARLTIKDSVLVPEMLSIVDPVIFVPFALSANVNVAVGVTWPIPA